VFWSKQSRQARAIARIRRELAFWGVDTSDLTNEQIEQGAVRFGRAIASMGLPAAVAAERLRAIGLALPDET